MAELKLTIDANKALRDAVAHLRAVLDWSNTERFAGRTRHENDAPSSARSFLDGLDELQTSPKTSKDLDLCDECGCIGLCDPRCSHVPVQQDEPEGVPPDVAPLPRPRPPRSHRDDESLRRWEARHPSVRFRPAVPLEQECEHVWRSSFGDTFCEKCNQDAPVEIASERCRTCKGSGTWADEGWSKPPQPCKACSGSGLAPIRKRKPTVPVQQDEPEGVCAFPNCSCTENRCPAKGERGPFCDHGFHPRLCGRCAPVPEAVTDEDEVQCQMCKTVQPRPDKECGHCGAGPKYLCPIHTRPAAVPVQQDEPEDDEYPRKDGDVLVLGPECIAAEDGSAIIWKGEHYSRSLQDFASDGEGSSADPGSPPARQTAAGSQPSPVPVQQDEPERQVFDTIWTELIALRDRLGQGKDIATGLQDLSSFVARFAFHDPVPVTPTTSPTSARGRTDGAASAVQQEPEDERMDTLLAEMGHERWVDAWREAADWRDQYRAGRDEVTGLLRAVVSEIDPMELTEMYAYLEADAYLATLDVLAGSESNAAGGSESRTGDDAEANPPLAATTPDASPTTPAVPSVGLNNDDQDGELLRDSRVGVSSVPSVGLRDRVACELANLEYERSGRPCETEDFYANADRVLSVLHEQQEPERSALMCSSYSGKPTNERCTKDAGHGGLHEGEMLRWSDGPRPLLPGCKTCGAATGETCHKDCPQQLAAAPAVGLRDRLIEHLADELEHNGWHPVPPDPVPQLAAVLADAALSVLHEAGTQEDEA